MYLYTYVFEDDEKGWNILKSYVPPKLSKSKMAANYGQRNVLGIKSIKIPLLILT